VEAIRMQVIKAIIKKVECIGEFQEATDFVYDIGIKGDTPYFFANNILAHNSCYFSVYSSVDDEMKNYLDNNRDEVVKLYDEIAQNVNDSFPEFMMQAFNTNYDTGSFIKCGREIVASRGVYVKKKKYALMVYDKEGKRLDVDNKPGELKVMGLDLKRADTPKYMQNFLEKVLTNVLTGVEESSIHDDVEVFREQFKSRPGWEKGTPKKTNGISMYSEKLNFVNDMDFANRTKALSKGKKMSVNMPGHIRAALNYEKLKEVFNDNISISHSDGGKVIVCKLLPNVYNMTSIAYPIDEPHLPQWFKDLPFDHAAMEDAIIDAKLNNAIGVLNWDLRKKQDLPDDLWI
jgi:hypothetical protein